MEKRLAECQRVIGYHFATPKLLEIALTHSSLRSPDRECNERLEFLGDSVLGLVITEELYRLLPDQSEGELTRIKSVVVSRGALYRASMTLGLARFAEFARGVGRRNELPVSVIANLVESVIGAIYLDAGFFPAREFVLRHLGPELDDVLHDRGAKNYKSLLQHEVQQSTGVTPTYRVLDEEGPHHRKQFTVAAMIRGQEWARGAGATKKDAEQDAARKALAAWQRRGRGRRRRGGKPASVSHAGRAPAARTPAARTPAARAPDARSAPEAPPPGEVAAEPSGPSRRRRRGRGRTQEPSRTTDRSRRDGRAPAGAPRGEAPEADDRQVAANDPGATREEPARERPSRSRRGRRRPRAEPTTEPGRPEPEPGRPEPERGRARGGRRPAPEPTAPPESAAAPQRGTDSEPPARRQRPTRRPRAERPVRPEQAPTSDGPDGGGRGDDARPARRPRRTPATEARDEGRDVAPSGRGGGRGRSRAEDAPVPTPPSPKQDEPAREPRKKAPAAGTEDGFSAGLDLDRAPEEKKPPSRRPRAAPKTPKAGDDGTTAPAGKAKSRRKAPPPAPPPDEDSFGAGL